MAKREDYEHMVKREDYGKDVETSSTETSSTQTYWLDISVVWEGERQIKVAAPAASEIAGLLMGLEETYERLAAGLGYPPHFLKVRSITNPELKLGLEGGKDAIEAVRDLLFELP